MYELEISHNGQGPDDLLPDQRVLFLDSEARIVGFSLLPWEEHCTECAMPACFSSCDLYEARSDGKCRRFKNGIIPIWNVPTLQGFAVKIEFKPWAQLMARGNINLLPIDILKRLERITANVDASVSRMFGTSISIAGRKNLPARMQRRIKRWISKFALIHDISLIPDYFLIEVLNLNATACKISLKIANPGEEKRAIPYCELLNLQPGFSRYKLNCQQIFTHVDPASPVYITLIPNGVNERNNTLSLYFGSIGFAADLAFRECPPNTNPAVTRSIEQSVSESDKSSPVKVVIWDLDHTLWHGILVEDGTDGVELKPGIADVIKELDSRGIVNSIASKNDYENAMRQLERFGLKEFFVFSRIDWGPKGDAVGKIIKDFNVSADTVVFIDDQPFERDQVRRVLPKVRTIDSMEYQNILHWPGFNPEKSTESANRRQQYVIQRVRDADLATFPGQYEDFLRECCLKLSISRSAGVMVDRLQELVQRTNQLNFSGRRYSRDEITQLLTDPQMDHFSLSCADRYGDYGVIGFALVDRHGPMPVLRDLMLSCRVQSKRIEHAFFSYLLNLYREKGFAYFDAIYYRTNRNQPAGRVFGEVGFTEMSAQGAALNYRFEFTREIPHVDVVDINEIQ